MKRICFIAQFPPPIHGLSKAVETLYNSSLNKKYLFEKIDITNNRRFIINIFKLLRSKADLFYLTISQSNSGNLRDIIIIRLIKIKKKKCLIHLHGGYYRKLVDNMSTWQRNTNYRLMSTIDGAIVLSDSLKVIFRGIVPDEKIYVVPNCIENQFLLDDGDFRRKVDESSKKQLKHVLFLSNFIRSKGYVDVLEMAKLEKNRVDNGEPNRFHFDFAGNFFERKEKKYFEVFVKNNNLANYVTYHGLVKGEEKRELLKNSDVFILLTRYPKEGQPISILEAMGNGLLVVTTDHAGIPDIVENEKTGIVISANEKKPLAKVAFERMGKCNYAKILLHSMEKVKENYLEDKYIFNMERVFNSVLSCNGDTVKSSGM